jgi:acetyltransferase-like isoleucine patch superfamily enzyme
MKSLSKKIITKLIHFLDLFVNDKTIPGTIIYGPIKNLRLGRNVSFGGNVVLCLNNFIEIDDDTMIAVNTVIHTSTHDYNCHPMWYKRIDAPIKIGKHVWIGVGAIILPGVIIEDYAVVAAGSIVTKNVPRGSIVAGNPAKIIKRRESSIFEKEPKIITHNDCIIEKKEYLSNYVGDKCSFLKE